MFNFMGDAPTYRGFWLNLKLFDQLKSQKSSFFDF